jgi:tellurite resistance protein
MRPHGEKKWKNLPLIEGKINDYVFEITSSKNIFFFLHSNEKLRVFATEAFRSENSTETSNYSTEVSVETRETFESVTKIPKFRFC